MRITSPAASAALAAGNVAMAVLVEMDLSTPLRLTTAGLSLNVGGATYTGLGAVGRIDEISDTATDVKGLSFAISGVPAANLALALAEPVQGKPVRLRVAIYSATGQLLDAPVRWAGRLDVMTVEETGDTATISVSAEHAGIDLVRPSVLYLSDIEQRRLYPGDLALQYMADQTEVRIVWPNAEFGKQ